MGVLGMINTLNSDSKVGELCIELNSDNELNIEIVNLIIDKYTNVYDFVILDYND